MVNDEWFYKIIIRGNDKVLAIFVNVHSIITTTQSQGANMMFLFFVVLMTIFTGDVVKAGKLTKV